MIYAINKRTKEHRDITHFADVSIGSYASNHDWLIAPADKDGWITWEGGDCPLPPNEIVEWRSEDGFESGVTRAGNVEWYEGARKIIAYRPTLDQRPCFDCGKPLTDEEEQYLEVLCNACASKEVHQGPEAPAWDGGLPPVGAMVEVHNEPGYGLTYGGALLGEDVEVKALFQSGDIQMAAVEHDGQCFCFRVDMLLPIRSEEDKAVEEMMRIYHESRSVSVPDAMRDIYRAGYRKA